MKVMKKTMLKVNSWNTVFRQSCKWALRRMASETLLFYDDNKEDWIECLKLLDAFDDDLCQYINIKTVYEFNITAEEFFELIHTYIDNARKENKHTVAMFFFVLWTSTREYFNEDLNLSDCTKYLKPATEEEIEYAKKYFSSITEPRYEGDEEMITHTHTFDNAQVLEYRGLRLIVDKEWSNAWLRDDKGNIHQFSLDWDWWYPIDEYLDLERGWKHD